MNWNNLKNNKCPKCSKELDFSSDKEMMMCTISCGFMISPQRMKEVISKKLSGLSGTLWGAPTVDNFSALQNLGYEDEEEEIPDFLL